MTIGMISWLNVTDEVGELVDDRGLVDVQRELGSNGWVCKHGVCASVLPLVARVVTGAEGACAEDVLGVEALLIVELLLEALFRDRELERGNVRASDDVLKIVDHPRELGSLEKTWIQAASSDGMPTAEVDVALAHRGGGVAGVG